MRPHKWNLKISWLYFQAGDSHKIGNSNSWDHHSPKVVRWGGGWGEREHEPSYIVKRKVKLNKVNVYIIVSNKRTYGLLTLMLLCHPERKFAENVNASIFDRKRGRPVTSRCTGYNNRERTSHRSPQTCHHQFSPIIKSPPTIMFLSSHANHIKRQRTQVILPIVMMELS